MVSAGPMPGRYADERAERHPDQRPHEVDWRDRRGKAIHQGKEGLHLRAIPSISPAAVAGPGHG